MTVKDLTDALDKFQAIHYFWNSFGIPAYERTTVPEGADLGDFYITYEAVTDSLDRPVPMSASIWKKNTMSWEEISQKAEEISDALIQVKTIPMRIGYLYITRGTPFAQRMDDEDDATRRIYLNIMAEFLAP